MGFRFAFRSGMSRLADFRGAEAARVPVGVVAGEVRLMQQYFGIPRYLRHGGACFIDSGAFAERTSGMEPNFDKVMSVYENVAISLEDEDASRLYVVAPDKVGDQDESLRRLARYRDRVVELIAMGVQMIVPIQSGRVPVAEMLDQVKGILGVEDFIVGIPANKDAMSIAECGTLNHHAFHILGRVQSNEEQIERIAALEEANPLATITADANWLRSRLGKVCQRVEIERETYRTMDVGARLKTCSPRSLAITAAIREDVAWG